MSLAEGDRILSQRRQVPAVSFEIFPPKNDSDTAPLDTVLESFRRLAPTFVSVTYGASGSDRGRSRETVRRLVGDLQLPTAAHITCVGSSRDETNAVIGQFWGWGVRHFVALRGDVVGGARYSPHPEGYENGTALVAGIKRRYADAEVSVSAYPEKHPDSPSPAADLDMLRRKVDAGANQAITQFFFDNESYLRYVERARAAGITIPIVPGIMPVIDFAQVARFAERCGTNVPAWFARRFEGLPDDPNVRQAVATAVAVEQVLDLVDRGVDQFHFYTLNRAPVVTAICALLGTQAAAVAA